MASTAASASGPSALKTTREPHSSASVANSRMLFPLASRPSWMTFTLAWNTWASLTNCQRPGGADPAY